MKLKSGSLNVVIIGDWNRLYCNPEYITEKLFAGKEMTIEVRSRGADYITQYNYNNLIIIPTQERMQFSITDVNNDSISLLQTVVINFIKNVPSPMINAYGINVIYEDSENDLLSTIIDEIHGANDLIDYGCIMISTEIKRVMKLSGKLYNVIYSYNGNETYINFNHHNEAKCSNKDINIQSDFVQSFLDDTRGIVEASGYELESEEV